MYVRVMQGEAVRSAVAGLRAAYDALAALPVDVLTRAELLEALDGLETVTCQLPVQSHRLLARLQAETTPREMGAKSWRQVLSVRWRLSSAEAGRRLGDAAELGPRQTLGGEPLDPVLACTAIAQTHGVITAEHVRILRDAMSRVPSAVDPVTRGQIEADLVRTAMGVGPRELKDNADRTLFLLDQDGPVPDDAERARRRGVSTAPQGARRDDPADRHPDPAGVGDLRGHLRHLGGTGNVSPRRPRAVHLGDPDAGSDRW